MLSILFDPTLTWPERFAKGCMLVIVLLFSLSIHEIMHGYAAYRLGDDTARLQGRLTLNPLAHLDPIGSLMMLIAGFGWAKPVQVNYGRLTKFKDRSISIRIVSVAGVTANLVVALLSYLLFMALSIIGFKSGLIDASSKLTSDLTFSGTIVLILSMLFNYMYIFNLMLMAFNLLPIPPLDGYHFIETFLPYNLKQKIQGFERYFGIIFLALILFGSYSGMSPLGSLIGWIEIPFRYIIETPINYFGNIIFNSL